MTTRQSLAWQIWKKRNKKIFERSRPSFQSWQSSFVEEATLQFNRLDTTKPTEFLSLIDMHR